ncbi:MAG TPA: c-type cytochrome biogenesis protein CcmI [Gammaproteobacteria bacterium]|nr:c-type cytochrome biogenesis protein CcmI [Gammaproteobacteria bacterium]
MLMFWVGIAVMVVVALTFVVLPLLWPRKIAGPDAVSLSIALHKDRLLHLNQQRQREELAPEAYNQMHLELEKSLLDEIPEVKTHATHPKRSTGLAIALLIILPVVAVCFYLYGDSFRKYADYRMAYEKTRKLNAEIAELGSVDNIITQLKQRVDAHPDGRGWFLLGRLYMKQERFSEAVAAFVKAEQLTQATPEMLIAHAEALYFINGHTLNLQARALLTSALKLQPNAKEAVSLLAIDAYQRGNFAQAASYWQQLLSQYPPDSDEGKILLRMIAEAQQHLEKSSNNTAKIVLPVSVQLAESLKNKVRGDETLFIYAQAETGSPMPLAVVKRLAHDLPLQITLNEGMGMLPGVSLADVDKVRVIARISKSGQPLAANGDLEGSSDVIEVHKHPEKIVVMIDKVH